MTTKLATSFLLFSFVTACGLDKPEHRDYRTHPDKAKSTEGEKPASEADRHLVPPVVQDAPLVGATGTQTSQLSEEEKQALQLIDRPVNGDTRWIARLHNSAKNVDFVVTGGNDYFIASAEAMKYLKTKRADGFVKALFESFKSGGNDFFDAFSLSSSHLRGENYDYCQMKWSADQNPQYNYLNDFAAEANAPSSPSTADSLGGNLAVEACEIADPVALFTKADQATGSESFDAKNIVIKDIVFQ